jgi:hypothetical protein
MSATTSQARVEIFDQREGLICTFPFRSVAEAEALLQALIAQPENGAYQLRLLGANGKLLQRWPGEPDARFNPVPVKTPELYQLLKQKEHWMQESRREIARSQALREQYGQERFRFEKHVPDQEEFLASLPSRPNPLHPPIG